MILILHFNLKGINKEMYFKMDLIHRIISSLKTWELKKQDKELKVNKNRSTKAIFKAKHFHSQ